MRTVPRGIWPAAGAVVVVAAVVAATFALGSPAAPAADASATPSPVVTSGTPSPEPAATPTSPAAADASPADPAGADPAAAVAPPADYVELPAVALDAPAEYGTGVVARVVGLEPVQAQAHGTGEISGPAVAVTVELTAGAQEVDLGDVVVNLYGPSGAAAPVVTGDPHHRPFQGDLAAGSSSSATYVLRPPEPGADARVTVAYSGSVPAATFEGPLP